MAARISEISFTKNPESEIFIKNPNVNLCEISSQ